MSNIVNKTYIFTCILLHYLVTVNGNGNDLIRTVPDDTIKGRVINEEIYIPVDDTAKMKSEQFYDSLESVGKEQKLLHEFLNLILVDDEKKSDTLANNGESYKKYKGRIIRDISFIRLDVFGPSVNDTSLKPNLFVQKAGNAVHVKTSKNVLYKNLLFREGDELNPLTIADNARILRSLPFIEDAKILVKPVKNTNFVDIEVITKDVFAYSAGLELSSINSGEAGVSFDNILGYGHKVQGNVFWLTGARPLLGYEGIYRQNNLGGSFINSEIRFLNSHGDHSFVFDMERKFITPDIKYAGGIRYEYNYLSKNIEVRDTVYENNTIEDGIFNVWFGRAFKIKGNGSGNRSTLMISGRYFSPDYSERPVLVSDHYLYNYHNRQLLLFSLGYSKQGFSKSSLIYSFGRTEDIPVGRMLQLTGGYEFGEYRNRKYAGISLSNGLFMNDSYLYNQVAVGGFFGKDYFEQGNLIFSNSFFTRLYGQERYKFRYFLNLNYKRGINRFADEFYSIENREGLNGMKSDQLKGTQKLTFSCEAVAFSPYYLNGFRFAFFAFINTGLIEFVGNSIFSSRAYTGLGVGLRLRNERLIFKTLQIKLAYYPIAPSDATYQYIQFTGEERPVFKDFFISSPAIIGSE